MVAKASHVYIPLSFVAIFFYANDTVNMGNWRLSTWIVFNLTASDQKNHHNNNRKTKKKMMTSSTIYTSFLSNKC